MLRRYALPLLILVWVASTPLLASRPSEGMNYTSEESIEYAQYVLVRAGYLEHDAYEIGIRDHATIAAVQDFQRRHKLNPSGRIDFDTMAMLSSHEPGPCSDCPPQYWYPAPMPEPEQAPAPPADTHHHHPAPEVSPPPAVEPKMPDTASPLPLIAIAGVAMVGLGILAMLKWGRQ